MISLIYLVLLSGVFITFVGISVLCSTTPFATGVGYFVILVLISFMADRASAKMVKHIPTGDDRSVWQVKILNKLSLLSRVCILTAVSIGGFYAYLWCEGTLF